MMNSPDKVFGLVLTGGHSRRMGRDKALILRGDGRSLLAHLYEMLSLHCQKTFVSIRADQATDDERKRFPLVADPIAELGPLGGILAAQRSVPDVAWLVVACDFPLLDAQTLGYLVRERARVMGSSGTYGADAAQRKSDVQVVNNAALSGRGSCGKQANNRAVLDAGQKELVASDALLATAYRGSDGLPEPLCAIYEPASRLVIEQCVMQGRLSPRRILLENRVHLVEPPDPRVLINTNTPEEMRHLAAADPSRSASEGSAGSQ